MNGQAVRWCKILCCGLLLLSFSTIFLWQSTPTATNSEDAPIVVSAFKISQVAALAVLNDGGSYGLIIDGTKISMIDAPDAALSMGPMKSLLYQVSHLNAEHIIEQPQDLSVYGFQKPTATVVLFLMDGSKIRLYLGDRAPLDGGWYLRREGTESVYLVNDTVATMMQYTVDNFRALDLFPTLDTEHLPQLHSIGIERANDTISVTCSAQHDGFQFSLTDPFIAPLNWQTVISDLVSPLAALQMSDFVGEHLALSDFGLDSPTYTLTISLGTTTKQILFAPADENYYYCGDPTGNVVVRVLKENLAFLDIAPAMLLKDSLYRKTVAETENITVIGNNLHVSLDLRGQGESLSGQCCQRTFTHAEVVELYQSLTAIPLAEPLPEGQDLTESSILKQVFTLRDGSMDVLDFIPISPRRCAVVLNGQSNYATPRSAVDELLRCAEYALSSQLLSNEQ